MAYTRTYRTIIPVEPDANLEVLRWLARESFERQAGGDSLRITDYRESTVPLEDIPPRAAKELPKPLSDYQFYEFTATATNMPPQGI